MTTQVDFLRALATCAKTAKGKSLCGNSLTTKQEQRNFTLHLPVQFITFLLLLFCANSPVTSQKTTGVSESFKECKRTCDRIRKYHNCCGTPSTIINRVVTHSTNISRACMSHVLGELVHYELPSLLCRKTLLYVCISCLLGFQSSNNFTTTVIMSI